MDRRSKILLWVAALAGGGFILDAVAVTPWLKDMGDVEQKIVDVDGEIAKANATLNRKAEVERGWKKVRDLLSKERKPDVQTHFGTHLREVADGAGVKFDYSWNQRQQGDFKEYVYETKFKLSWEQFVELLRRLNNSKEFLKPMRISVTSQYERGNQLDLDLKVSTIEYQPAPVKAGGK